MFELHAGQVGRGAQRRFEVAEAGGEDQLRALRGKVAHHALGVGPFGHRLDEARRDLVAQRTLHRLARLIVLIRPAGLADRADVDEADLQGRGGVAGRANEKQNIDASRRPRMRFFDMVVLDMATG